MNNQINQKINRIIDSTSLILIGLISLGYCLFDKKFAELHISFSFLNFPIFIGEIIFFLCLILLLAKLKINHQINIVKLKSIPVILKNNRFYILLIFYYIFVLTKAFWGYSKHGPLAFRHAALFYYSFFAVFGRIFYRSSFFDDKKILFICLIFLSIFMSPVFYDYFAFACFIFVFVLLNSHPNRAVKYLLFLAILASFPYKTLLITSRTMLVSNLAALIFIAISLFLILKRNSRILVVSVAIMFLVLVVAQKIVDKDSVESLINIRGLINIYNKYNKNIIEKQDNFKRQEVKEIKLYNPEIKPAEKVKSKIERVDFQVQQAQQEIEKARAKIEEIQLAKTEPQPDIEKVSPTVKKEQPELKPTLPETEETQAEKIEEIQLAKTEPQPDIEAAKQQVEKVKSQIIEAQNTLKEAVIQTKRLSSTNELNEIKPQIEKLQSQIEKLKSEIGEIQPPQKKEEVQEKIKQKPVLRTLEGAYTNSLFRIFIWKDALTELKEQKPLLGFDFGKPFRSKNIEILGWSGEWMRDGWISIHNSYLNIIYRAGILGMVFIITVFTVLFKMIKESIIQRAITGILICGILISWLLAANFILVLELPYHAIPLWSLFGMTLSYLKDIRKAKNVK